MRYKGRYSAQVIIDIDIDVMEGMKPFDDIKKTLTEELTPELQRLIEYEITDGVNGMKVDVIQMYAELYEVDKE